jgi:hypothetical protein
VSIVEMGRSRDKLTQDVDRVSNVRMGDPNVNKASNKLTIASGISKWCTVSGFEVNTKLHRSINSAVISESSTGNEVVSVLFLREENTIKGGGDLRARK